MSVGSDAEYHANEVKRDRVKTYLLAKIQKAAPSVRLINYTERTSNPAMMADFEFDCVYPSNDPIWNTCGSYNADVGTTLTFKVDSAAEREAVKAVVKDIHSLVIGEHRGRRERDGGAYMVPEETPGDRNVTIHLYPNLAILDVYFNSNDPAYKLGLTR